MKAGLDFGSSTIDLVLREGDALAGSRSFASNGSLDWQKAIQDLPWQKVEKVFTTGYGAENLGDSFQGKPAVKVDEIKAIGLGGRWLSGRENCLVVNIGSGSCLVLGKQLKHLGGTAVGGRTLSGLGKLLIGLENIKEIEALASKGDLDKVDLTMEKIYPQGIGLLDGKATAAHFGDLKDYGKEDLALALFNLTGQVIGSMAAFAAKAEGVKEIVFTGKLINSPLFQEIVKERVLKLFSVELIVPRQAEVATAVGATLAEEE